MKMYKKASEGWIILELKSPVCSKKVGWFDICDHCNYQNSGSGENLDGPTGPNKMTLREAKEAYKKGEKII